MKTAIEIQERIDTLNDVINQCLFLGKRYGDVKKLKKDDFRNMDSIFQTGLDALKERTTLEWVLKKLNA